MIVKQQLAEIVGPDSVSNDAEALEGYCRDFSFVDQIRPSCVVKPSKADEVQKIIQLANETETALVPVSSGERSAEPHDIRTTSSVGNTIRRGEESG